MINLRDVEIAIVDNLEKYLGCKVIRSNQTAPTPSYPYLSYTITSPMIVNNGTYGEFVEDNVTIYRKEFQQVWSFTVQSDDDMQSKTLAFKAYDFFDNVGTTILNENGAVVQRLSNITNRDNILTIEYEYRNGFDVTFAFMNEITKETNEISDFKFNYNSN